jgi:hypothetical protein
MKHELAAIGSISWPTAGDNSFPCNDALDPFCALWKHKLTRSDKWKHEMARSAEPLTVGVQLDEEADY